MCYQYRAHKKTVNNHAEYDEWVKSHEKDCMINHDGSSESMETHRAIIIFKRSIEKGGCSTPSLLEMVTAVAMEK